MTYNNLSKESYINSRICINHYYSFVRTSMSIFGEGYIILVLISMKWNNNNYELQRLFEI